MLRFKIWFRDDDYNEWMEYWTIKDYILRFDDYEWNLEEDCEGYATTIALVEIHYHKGCKWPYYEKEIIPNERN